MNTCPHPVESLCTGTIFVRYVSGCVFYVGVFGAMGIRVFVLFSTLSLCCVFLVFVLRTEEIFSCVVMMCMDRKSMAKHKVAFESVFLVDQNQGRSTLRTVNQFASTYNPTFLILFLRLR